MALAGALLFGLMLGARPLSSPDEGRYVEIPREMAATGDWLTPRLNGVKYFEKPPLFYWVEALLIRLFGLNEWSVRLGPALFAIFGCLSVYYAGRRLFGRLSGLFSSAVLATSVLYYALSRLVTLDMPLTFFLTATLLLFLLAHRETRGRVRNLFFLGSFAFAALATLTKGLIGIVFPALIITVWMSVTGEWRMLKTSLLVPAAALFLLITAPWHILVNRMNPEFFNFYFVHEHIQRYVTTVHHHNKPFWFFLPILLGGLFPWSVFLVQAIRHGLPATFRDRTRHKETIFLLLWAGLIFLFFSASGSKLIPYLLPVLPPLALLIGNYLANAAKDPHGRGVDAGLIILGALAGVLVLLLLSTIYHRTGAVPPEFAPYAFAVAASLITGIVLTWILLLRVGRTGALISVAGTAILLLITAGIAAPHFDMRTIKPLALKLKPHLGPNDDVVAYRTYYQDLPVYIERRITVVDWTGELAFGMTAEDTSGWMINSAELRKRLRDPLRTIYLLTDADNYEALRRESGLPLYRLAQHRNNILACNREATL